MKKIFTLFAAVIMMSAASAETLTVCDGTARNTMFPVYGLYTDTEGTTSQMIYPADMLEAMQGTQITGIKFYIDGNTTYGCTVGLSLMETDETAFDGALIEGAAQVASLKITNGDSDMSFEFDEPFLYDGGNLLVSTEVTTKGSYGTTYYNGMEQSGDVSFVHYIGWFEVNDAYSFLPKVTFTYDATSVGVNEINADKAVADVSYYDMAGRKVSNPTGIVVEVTTYADGTTCSAKVLK